MLMLDGIVLSLPAIVFIFVFEEVDSLRELLDRLVQ